MSINLRSSLVSALVLAFLTGIARADTFTFVFTDPSQPGEMLSFSLSENANALVPDGLYRLESTYSPTVQIGSLSVPSPIDFQDTGAGIDLNSGDDVITLNSGSLFTGVGEGLGFQVGSYSATLFNVVPNSGLPEGTIQGTLTIGPTPEPSSFALLSTGLLGVAGVARRRFA